MTQLQHIHIESAKIFEKELTNPKTGLSYACDVYKKLTGGRLDCENCLGENFNQLISRLKEDWFKNYTPAGNLDYYFSNYVLLLYLFVERIDFVFDIINKDRKSKLFNDFQQTNFKKLRIINKWANFIKHPKEFLFSHWPSYFFEGDIQISGEDQIVIDTNFIMNHYFSENNPRPMMLENNRQVSVEVPNLIILTQDFCSELKVFFSFICENKIVSDFLQKKSTIEDYYLVEGETIII